LGTGSDERRVNGIRATGRTSAGLAVYPGPGGVISNAIILDTTIGDDGREVNWENRKIA
jgi:hypothetical protein